MRLTFGHARLTGIPCLFEFRIPNYQPPTKIGKTMKIIRLLWRKSWELFVAGAIAGAVAGASSAGIIAMINYWTLANLSFDRRRSPTRIPMRGRRIFLNQDTQSWLEKLTQTPKVITLV
ncbi:MAG: hypothetical protein QNJ72_45505 [Pleurocapsa sp. MO_226.B13]|nr:hypothetical protein [Pleurocapsa sp. MO_226.B13]